MAEVIAVDLDGELSRNGALTNTLFTRDGNRGKIDDVSTTLIKINESGSTRPDYYVGCDLGLALSLDGVNYNAEAEPLGIGDVDYSGTTIYVKCVSQRNRPVGLILPQTGIVSGTSGNVNVSAGILSMSSMVLDPTVTATQFANITAETLAGTISILEPVITTTVAGGITIDADLLTLTSSILAPTVSGDASVAPSVLSLTSSILAPTVTAESGGSVTWAPYYANGVAWAGGKPWKLLTTKTTAIDYTLLPSGYGGEGSPIAHSFYAKIVKATGISTSDDITGWFLVGTSNPGLIDTWEEKTSAEQTISAQTIGAGEYFGIIMKRDDQVPGTIISLPADQDVPAGKVKVKVTMKTGWDSEETGNYFTDIIVGFSTGQWLEVDIGV